MWDIIYVLVALRLATGIPTLNGNYKVEVTEVEESPNPSLRSLRLKRVELEQGDIQAQEKYAKDGLHRYFAFKGIPYAQPPVGSLRFKDPVAASPWTGARNGSFVAPVCPQNSRAVNVTVIGEEDCLYLNVFTKDPDNQGMPVMVYIHGGGFQDGGMAIYPAEPLVTKDVVLVTIQYRLGTLGFLSTEDSVIPGNLGLKDQTLALQWVQKNIQKFGGDPQRVTLFGLSAGAGATHFQVLSPLAKGLFHRAILQSGTAICPWSIAEGHRDIAMKIGHKLSCNGLDSLTDTDKSMHLLTCLQNASINDLVRVPEDFIVFLHLPIVMAPRIDGIFLPDHPARLLKEGNYNKINMISGITRDETGAIVRELLSSEDKLANLNKNLKALFPSMLMFEEEEENPVYLAQRSLYYYLQSSYVSEDNAERLKELTSDRGFRICHDETSQLHSKNASEGNRFYRYELQHRGQHSIADYANSSVSDNWISHGDDVMYLFNSSGYPFFDLKREDDLLVSDIMLALWTNFAATGNPTPDQSLGFKWTPALESDYSYLSITPAPTMVKDRREKIRHFWKTLPTRQNKMLYPEIFTECSN